MPKKAVSMPNWLKNGAYQTNKTMNTTNDYTTLIEVDNSAEEVFTAINQVNGWWQGEIIGSANNLDDEFTYEMQPYHFTKQKVIELIPNQKVVWLITESKINFVENKNEWLNTTLVFEISAENNKTKLTFTHKGLNTNLECYNGCSNGWQQLIHKSLLSFITTGKGVDVF